MPNTSISTDQGLILLTNFSLSDVPRNGNLDKLTLDYLDCYFADFDLCDEHVISLFYCNRKSRKTYPVI